MRGENPERMTYAAENRDNRQEVADLFEATFAASEGAAEGRLVGALARELLAAPEDDVLVFSARDDEGLAGCIIFSPLTFEEDERNVFVLAPVAVRTDRQGQGVGQALLTHGLDTLRGNGVDVAVTYGDPDYYAKVGFRQITQAEILPPRRLSHPEGWLALSLTGQPLAPLKGPSRCIAALDDPAYW